MHARGTGKVEGIGQTGDFDTDFWLHNLAF